MQLTHYGANQAMIDSTLNKTTPGDVFDDLVVTHFGYCFGSLDYAREYSRNHNRVLSYVTTETLDVPEDCIQRREYIEISPKDPGVDTTFTIKAFDPICSNWKEVVLGIWGDIENYNRRGTGIGIFDGSVQVSEAMVGFLGNTHWEIGTITHADYRGQGLSSLASYHLIKKLIKEGVAPSWSCNENNPASYKVAEKIGFRNHRKYNVYVIKPDR